MIRRFFAFMLTFLMLFSSVPIEALATMIHEESAVEALAVTGSDETTAPVETTEAALDAPSPLSETTVPETTVGETVPETTVGETTTETTEETVPETTVGETVPETTVEETVPETTVGETVPETTEETVDDHVHSENSYDADGNLICEALLLTGDEITNVPAQAVTEPALTGYWNQDAYALVKAYYDGNYVQAEDGTTVFGEYYGNAGAENWNTYFAAYCLKKAGVNTDYFPVVETSASEWKNALEAAGFALKSNAENGDLLFYHPYEDSSDIRVGFYHDWKLLTADDTVTHDNALHGKEGGIAVFDTWRCQVIGYVGIPDMDRTAKVFTDSTWQTAATDSGISGTVEGSLSAGTQIRICPLSLTEDQKTAINTLGLPLNAYRVAHYVNDTQADGSSSFTIKFKSNDFVPPKAVKVYKLENGEATSEIKCTALDGGISFNASGVVDFVIVTDDREVTVTTAEELAAAVQSGMPNITLGADLSISNTLTINQVVEIDLNAHTLTAEGSQPLFDVRGVLTVDDSGSETVTKSSGTNISRPDSVDDAALGSVAKGENGKAVLTYYTTQSVDKVPSVTYDNGATDEYRYQHTVTAAGMVENKSSQPLFVVNGGTLNISGGVYTGNLDGGYTGRGIVQNSGTTNLTGGYLAGFNVQPSRTDWSDLNDFGGAIRATGGNLNIGEAVIAANQAISGAGIYAANTTVTLENGVISGNKATGVSDSAINNNDGPHFGGAGVYLGEHSSITVNGANSYITNNSAPNANGYADGGGAIFARKWTTITINNGYITSNTVGGGGGAIRTIYGTETNYTNMTSEAVKQAVEMSIYINASYICGNFCRYAEGGGVSVNAGTGCWVTGGYINNNVTMTQRDWGGGGLFNANGSYLELKNVLITENTALGLGGGVAGCSTGDIHLAVTEGGAMFDNTAMAQNWSGEGSQKRDDQTLAKENANFDLENADDYFCVHFSKVEAQMLGRGSCDWVGTCDDTKVTPPQRAVLEATKVMGLTSYAMDPGKKEARMAATAYINGNYSNVHGGGIMCNGVLDVGTPVSGPLPAWLEVVGTKVFQSKTPLANGMFEFELLDAEGEVVTTGANDAEGNIAFGKQLVFENAGTYTYTIQEKAGTDTEVQYDDTVYTMVVTTVADKDGNICIDSVTINGTAVAGIAEDAFYVTLPDSTIEFVNTSKADLIVQAHKVWDDDNDRDGKRPATIEVELYANGVATGKKLELSNRNSTTNSNFWHSQFLNLNKYDEDGIEIEYTVKEVSVPAGYTVAYSQDEDEKSLVITNTHIPETTEITATKVWQDNNDQDGIRPASVTLTLYADGTPYVDADGKGRSVTLNGEGNTWTATISGLPKHKNIGGTVSEIVYSFEETSVPEGYTEVVAGTTVTNSHTPAETKVSFQKTWADNDDQDGKRPDSITVNLLADGTKVDSMTVTADTNYGGTFDKLPKFENGIEIVYTLTEEPVEGYTTSITGSSADGFVITNTHEIEKTELSVKKVWNDFGNQDNKRTPGIVVALYGNAKEKPIETAILNEDNNWEYTWKDLDLYAGGNYVDYSVVEIAYIDASGATIHGVPSGYTVSHSYNNEEGSIIWTEATVTNTLTPELTTLNIQKQWNDSNNQDGLRPKSITLTLWKTTTQPTEIVYVNGHAHYVVDPNADSGWVKAVDSKGQPYVLTMTPTESGAWDADFKDLPKYEAGKRIYYAVTEEAVAGYTSSYELDPDTNVLYLKNTHETEDTQISVFKIWNDNNNQDGKRPASISVSLYGRNKVNPLETITLPDANGNWSYTWTGLDKNYNGEAIKYTVVETAVPGYNVDAQGNAQDVSGAVDASGNVILTNTYIPQTTSISVIKEWNDAQNQDGKRPTSITVELMADGEPTGKTLNLTAETNWQGTFSNLPVNRTKTDSTEVTKEIKYEIREEAVAAYNVDREGNPQTQIVAVENGVVKLTNTHVPEVVSVTANKIWDDNNNQDGKRPASIILHLLADGEHTNQKATLTPDENGNWSYTWNNLPKYSDGKEIDYGVVEEHFGKEYVSEVNGFTVTNKYSPEKTYISVLKHWVDGNNQDNVRPDSITVTLLANGQPTGETLVLNESNHWYGSFTDLEKYGNGTEINYSVQETAVEGYKAGVISGSMADGFVITNERDVEKTEIKVSKVWEDENNRDGVRPASVTVTLYRDGIATDKSVELSAANNWSHTWDELDVHHSKGKTYVYSVVETVPEGYEAITTGNAAEGYVITNKHEPEITSIPVIKVWDDALNQDGKRPGSITVELLADGQSTGKTLKLTAAVNWQGTFSDLPVNRAKTDSSTQTQPIVYTVEETAVAEYNVDDNGTAQKLTVPVVDGKVTITNTHKVEVTKLNVRKVWDDFNDKAQKRPYAVVIALHENGKLSGKTLTLSSENGWQGAWDNMPRYSGGTWIAYTVAETGFYQTAEDYESGNLTMGVPSGYMVSHSYDSTDTSNPVAIVTNTYAPDSTGLNVQKRWNDDNNREGIRPTQITVTLYYKIGEKGTWEVMEDSNGDPMTTVLTEANQWDADFLGLPKYSDGQLIYYNVVETPVEGYEAVYKLDPATGVVTVTNTNPINKDVKIAVSKVWDDKDDQDGIRPEEIVVTLYANGIKTSSTKTLNADNEWKAEWTGLYEYYKGSKIIYTVVEENVPAGYKMKVTSDAATGFVITNTHNTETVDIPVAKIWDDNDNQDGIRPESIKVTLFADGKATSKVMTLNAENLWKGTFTGLDKYTDGVEIKYSVQEAAVEGYNVDENGKAQTQTLPVVDGKVTITNVHAPEKTAITAIKKWHDNDDQDGKRPESITVHLLANGIHMGEEYVRVLNAENDWRCTWENLDKYVSGQLILYTVYEEPVEFKKPDIEAESEDVVVTSEKYITDYVRDSETQVTINNRYAPETTEIKAIKVWEDDNNRDGLRSKTVDVKLLANGEDTGMVMTMKKSNNWTVTWTDLPKYENHGKLIEYTVEEVDVPTGYVCDVVNHEEDDNTYILTNTHAPETTGIKVTKTWKDDNDNDGVRPDGLIVQLYADGTAVEGGRVILNDLNGWTHTFQSTEEMPLYVYDSGELINYYVQEIGYVSGGVEYSGMPEGYKGKISQDENSYDITITNTRASEKTALTVNKVWEDGNNSDGVRPSQIKVTLLKNGTEVETVTLNKKNNWTYTWKNLYKYAGGVEVKYTVREAAVGTYTADYAYTTSADGKSILATVTNSYTPAGKWFAIQKIWNDNNNAEGLRPTAVTVQIYKDGVAYGDPIVLSAANKWQSPMCLPVYENGVAINWTVKEINIPRYYSVSYDQSTMTITNTIQSKEVPRTGDNSNLLLWLGLLGLCGAGAATVLFVDKKKKRGK